MLVLPHADDGLAEHTPDRPGAGTDSVRPIGEILTIVLSRYELAPRVAPAWVDALPGDAAAANLVLAD